MVKGVAFGLFACALSLNAHAVEPNNFTIEDTKDLAVLCTVADDHPLRDAAVHFCHGYLVGAYHYHVRSTAGQPIVCMPDPAPSRNEAIQEFIAWANDNPQYLDEEAVDTMLRWLVMRFPCES
jgi:hypothetical protein